MKDYKNELANLIMSVVKEGASDLHLSVGRHPTIRVAGTLIPLVRMPILLPEDVEGLIFAMLDGNEREMFLKDKELDFSYSPDQKIRFRVNIFYQRGFMGSALRLVPEEIKGFKDLNLPDALMDFAGREQGFFLVVGPIGHGKSTTMAAMVDHINRTRAEHIMTIEDPVEYIFTQDKSIIDQREVKIDTQDFSSALRAMFRQDVNVAMIGEMRDTETMGTAVTAAETGHLVLSSLHTNNAAQTVDRIIDSFPSEQQNQIRLQLSNALIGIFSQRLIPRISGGRIPAYELLIANTAIKNLIRENRIHEIDIVIETSLDAGMVGLNRSLSDLVHAGEISPESAYNYSLSPRGLEGLI